MFFLRLLPGMLKELITHVPTVLFEVTDWHELAAELPKLSRKIIQKEGRYELLADQQKFLAPFAIRFTDHVEPNLDQPTKAQAEQFLTLYFTQLFSPHGIFLDLRASHFEQREAELLWNPPSIWVKFDPEFRKGLLDIYAGFYHQDETRYRRGLINAGLMQERWPVADQDTLAKLFQAQFGDSITTDVDFTLEGFKNSMLKIAHFLLEKKVIMSKDFLYLGIYLVTLYSTLEKSRAKLSVRDIYLAVEKKYA